MQTAPFIASTLFSGLLLLAVSFFSVFFLKKKKLIKIVPVIIGAILLAGLIIFFLAFAGKIFEPFKNYESVVKKNLFVSVIISILFTVLLFIILKILDIFYYEKYDALGFGVGMGISCPVFIGIYNLFIGGYLTVNEMIGNSGVLSASGGYFVFRDGGKFAVESEASTYILMAVFALSVFVLMFGFGYMFTLIFRYKKYYLIGVFTVIFALIILFSLSFTVISSPIFIIPFIFYAFGAEMIIIFRLWIKRIDRKKEEKEEVYQNQF